MAAHTVAAAYAPTAATVAVRQAPVSVAAATAAAYGGYQPTHAATDYSAYAQRQPEVPPPPPPVTSQNYQVNLTVLENEQDSVLDSVLDITWKKPLHVL